MAGWGKLVAGAVIGVAGTIYATNEEFRKRLPGAARDFPVAVRRRLENAVSAGRAASWKRREEILRDLERHGGQHPIRQAHAATDEASAVTFEATSEGDQRLADEAPETGTKSPTQPAEHGKEEG